MSNAIQVIFPYRSNRVWMFDDAALRLIVFAGRQIVGDVEADLIKISTDGRKVSFLRYGNFETAAHPELSYSVKVYLPKAAHSFRDCRQPRKRHPLQLHC